MRFRRRAMVVLTVLISMGLFLLIQEIGAPGAGDVSRERSGPIRSASRPTILPKAPPDLSTKTILFDGVHGWPGSNMIGFFTKLKTTLIVDSRATIIELSSPPVTAADLAGVDIYMVTEPSSTALTDDERAAIT
ncbi:MAG: hypothetical protein ACE5JP_02155, partial [Candidatus Bipolaricaulia bacterium]